MRTARAAAAGPPVSRLASPAVAALLAAALAVGCGAPSRRPGPPVPRGGTVPTLPPGNGAFEEGGVRYFAGEAVVAVPAGDGGEARRRAVAEAVARANAAVDLFFHPAADPASVDPALFEGCARRNLAFGTASAMIPRGRVALVPQGPPREYGPARAEARITEEGLLAAIAEADVPEESRRSLRERLASRMGEYVEAWKRVRGN